MSDSRKALDLLSEFRCVVDSIYGVYLDSTRGFYLLKEQHNKEQQLAIKMLATTAPDLANIGYLDKQKAVYGRGAPNKPNSVILHTCSQAELRARNEERGANHKFIANMCLVAIYQYWEDRYRGAIASALGFEKKDVYSDVMGDIRLLRKSIIHRRAEAVKEVKKCKLLKWFNYGDQIFIDRNMFNELIDKIDEFIAKLTKEIELENCQESKQ